MKFNPGVYGDDELISTFVARAQDFRTLLDKLFNRHKNVLVIGPRGAGKTTLVRRVAAEARLTESLSDNWTPLVFAEESYEICSLGEFWLETLYRLSIELRDHELLLLYEDLKKEDSHNELSRKAFSVLKSYHNKTKRNLLIVVENLNLLLEEQLDRSANSLLGKILKQEKWLRFLGTALPSFEESNVFSDSWSELFEVVSLAPLSLGECRALWNSIAHRNLSNTQMRPVQILTGGNPRLIRILADFSGKASFRELMDNLIHLVDEHTEYFKGRLDSLPVLERKIFVAILQKWDPISARDIAEDTRIEITGVSPLLIRLQKRGVVSVVTGKGRKLYQAAERLYNIYYLLRRGGNAQENRVRLAVRFMVQFYRGRKLIDRARKLAIEACNLAPSQREDHYLAYKELFNCSISAHLKDRIRDAVPQEFLKGVPSLSEDIHESVFNLIAHSQELLDQKDHKKAEQLLRKVLNQDSRNGHAHAHLAVVLEDQGKIQEALKEFREAIALAPQDHWAALRFAQLLWRQEFKKEANSIVDGVMEATSLSSNNLEHLASVLHDLDRFDQSEQVCLRWIDVVVPEDAGRAWYNLAELYHYHLDRYLDAQEAYEKSIKVEMSPSVLAQYADLLKRIGLENKSKEIAQLAIVKLREMPKNYRVWGLLGQLFFDLNDKKEAVEAYRKASELNPENPEVWADLGRALGKSGSYEEAALVLRKSISIKETASAYYFLSLILKESARFTDAEEALQNAIRLDPNDPSTLTALGILFEEQGKTDKANDYYFRAVSSGDEAAIPLLIGARILASGQEDFLVSELKALTSRPLKKSTLASAAWVICRNSKGPLLKLAEDLVRQVLLATPADGAALHTLATILGKSSRWNEALILCRELIGAVERGELSLQDFTDFIIDAAAAGYSEQCLSILKASNGLSTMEPLVVGLELNRGSQPVVAQEILEVGRDIAQRIGKMALTH